MKTWQKIMIVSAALAVVPGAALAECPSYPDVSWWGAMNHEKTIRYVDKKHKGTGLHYMAKWKGQLAKVEMIRDLGGSIVYKKQGIKLEGDALGAYIGKLQQRVTVIRCLAEEQLMANTDKLAQFSTAAGSRN